MDVAGFQCRISGRFEAFLVIFCLHVLKQGDVRLAFPPRFLHYIFQEGLLEGNFSGI